MPYTSSTLGTQEFGQFSSPFSVKACTVQDYFLGARDRERKKRDRETDRMRDRQTDSEVTRGTRF